jgi:hypothetical protein
MATRLSHTGTPGAGRPNRVSGIYRRSAAKGARHGVDRVRCCLALLPERCCQQIGFAPADSGDSANDDTTDCRAHCVYIAISSDHLSTKFANLRCHR